jgi:hypothetical protein
MGWLGYLVHSWTCEWTSVGILEIHIDQTLNTFFSGWWCNNHLGKY